MRRHHRRPPRSPAERRVRTKLIRFASAELEIVNARAYEAGRPVACFIREAALGSVRKARPRLVGDDALRDLAALATSLDALARSAANGLPVDAARLERARTDALLLIGKLDRPAPA